jgi:DNA-binding NarL/FixJ family response regulator
MSTKRTLILVEDSNYQFPSLRDELAACGWEVIRAQDERDFFFQIEQCQAQGISVDAVAVDLGIPPAHEDPFKGGIPLIKSLRKKWKSLPILAYTALTPTAFSYEKATRILLKLRASFLYLRPMGEKVKFSSLIELTWLGYVVLAPAAADQLHYALSDLPDPLETRHWETLKLLSDGNTYHKIAANLGDVTMNGVRARVRQIKDTLVAVGELEEYQDQTEDLINWYNDNKVRYCRDG